MWEDNIKTVPIEMGLVGMDWIDLAEDTVKFYHSVMKPLWYALLSKLLAPSLSKL
jgi:hypothetical protein